MRLATIKTGDIVQVDGSHAVVRVKDRGLLVVRGICDKSIRRVKAVEVERHWRLSRAGS